MRLYTILKIIRNTLLSPIYGLYQNRLIDEVKSKETPIHIGFILDGNRRFADVKGLEKKSGHLFGARKVEELLEWCYELNIKVITLYALSTENLLRPNEEVKELFNIAKNQFKKILSNKKIHENKVHVKALGNLSILPEDVLESISMAEENTSKYENFYLNVCMAYGSLDEVVNAIKKIAKDVKENKIGPEEIDVDMLKQNLLTHDHPDPDLIIRTGGESRLSNFMLLQAAYSELFFIDVFLPEFRKIDFLRIIRDFQKIERRYGK